MGALYLFFNKLNKENAIKKLTLFETYRNLTFYCSCNKLSGKNYLKKSSSIEICKWILAILFVSTHWHTPELELSKSFVFDNNNVHS
jgi:putative heme degradation protein